MHATRPEADEMLDEMSSAGNVHVLTPVEKPRLGKVRYTHEACIDLILLNPAVSQNELAATFGYSVGWMSIAINSDAFQARLAERKGELVDPMIRASLNERLRAVTQRSLDVLLEKLELPTAKVSDQLVLGAAALGIKGLGLGNTPPPAPAAAEHLNAMAERLRSFMVPVPISPISPPPAASAPDPNVVDVQAREVSP